jgi:pilus assembly protein FimV
MRLATDDKTMLMQPGELAGLTGGFDDSTATHDITQDSVAAQAFSPDPAATPDFTLNPAAAGTPANVPDFMIDAAPDDQTKTTTVTGDSAVKSMVNAIDFNFDSPPSSLVTPAPPVAPAGLKHDSTMVLTPENQQKAADLTMDIEVGGAAASKKPAPVTATGTSSVIQIDPTFKLDLGGDAPAVPGAKTAGAARVIPDIKLDGLSLSLDDAPTADSPAPAAGGAKDDHWYDVQTKFDLAKAYQEMGDKDGAREILQEVIKEGDSAQQAEAKQLLDSLG